MRPIADGGEYQALICITTCRRMERLRRYLPHFARFCESDARFSLVVALDGTETEYLEFCERWQVPLVYSDEREGVGLSKNRVLKRFPGFEYYFFLDDDVELVDGRVFPAHVELARSTGIHHFSLFERGGIREATGETIVNGGRILHGLFGGGQFNFFTREGLKQVGGWHPGFVEYLRWGHTEHSYRFFDRGLAPAPFNVAEDLSETCIWHYPPPVTSVEGMATDGDQISAFERELMDSRLGHVPVTTLTEHHFNGQVFGGLGRLAAVLSDRGRYPLVTITERQRCRSDLSLWRARGSQSRVVRWMHLLGAAMHWPGNPRLRHQLKTGR